MQNNKTQYQNMKRVIDATQENHHHYYTTTNHNHAMTTSQSGQDSSKSKFQIRSIVEIYENQSESQQQQQQDIDLSYKTATHVQETVLKEIINEPVLKGNKTDTESRTEIISLLFLFSTLVIKCYKYILEFYVLFFFLLQIALYWLHISIYTRYYYYLALNLRESSFFIRSILF